MQANPIHACLGLLRLSVASGTIRLTGPLLHLLIVCRQIGLLTNSIGLCTSSPVQLRETRLFSHVESEIVWKEKTRYVGPTGISRWSLSSMQPGTDSLARLPFHAKDCSASLWLCLRLGPTAMTS